MRFKDTPEEKAWREEVKSFLKEYCPAQSDWRAAAGEGAEGDEKPDIRPRPGGSGFAMPTGVVGRWASALAERRWIAPAWPKEYGGAGLGVMDQFIMNQEFAEAGVPGLWNGNGPSWTGPTIITHGTEEQKKEHLPKILSCETLWAQGFSEPGAGSDLASIVTRAVRDGDDYVVNGQKIWTTNGHRANWMILMARTNPDAPKHRGITYFLLDMTSPGITVQPLVQMTGGAGFNQVFFDNVRVPAKNVVGEVDRGWYVSMTTLDFERSGVGGAVNARKNVENLIKLATGGDKDKLTFVRNPSLRLELADRMIEAEVLMSFAAQIAYMQNAGKIPNHEASCAKLYGSELSQRIARTAMRAVGLFGLVTDSKAPYFPAASAIARSYVGSVSSTIGGGTSEIQRNIIAQRGLGLPRN